MIDPSTFKKRTRRAADLVPSLSSKTLPMTGRPLHETRCAPAVDVERVAQVQVFGAAKYAVRIQVDQSRSVGISIDQLPIGAARTRTRRPAR
jgi:multidrug efflux pump subunit AcrB